MRFATRTNKEQRDNCAKLVAILEPLHVEQFDMGFWGRNTDGGAMLELRLPPVGQRAKPACGTTACMAGWAVVALTDCVSIRRSTAWMPRMIEGISMQPAYYRSDVDGSDDLYPYSPAELGEMLLGPEAATLFDRINAAENEGKTDKQWIIEKLNHIVQRFDNGDDPEDE